MDDILTEIDALRRVTRTELQGSSWCWLLVWAVASAGSVATLAVPALNPVAGWYWMVAVPVAVVVMVLLEARVGDSARARNRAGAYWLTGAGIGILNFGGGVLLPGDWMVIWLWAVMAAGFAVLLHLDRHRLAAGAFASLVPVFITAGALSDDRLTTSSVIGALFTAALVVTAWIIRSRAEWA